MKTPIDFTVREDVAWITINRPEKRNALSTDVIEGLIGAFEQASRSSARVVVLTGAGDKAFSAGGDLGKFLAEQKTAPGLQGGRFVTLFKTMNGLEMPIIGAINGHCLAGAFGVALACDMLISVEQATFGTPEILVGLWPMMISALIYRNLPRKLANELLYTGRKISAEEAASWGIVNRVVKAGDLNDAVTALAKQIAQHPAEIIKLGRQALSTQQDMPFQDALEYLERELRQVLASPAAAEGIQRFLNRSTK